MLSKRSQTSNTKIRSIAHAIVARHSDREV
jgi:hypothetical protein